MEETYTIKLYCSNCGYIWKQEFPKGEEVGILNKCPNCGCWTGKKG